MKLNHIKYVCKWTDVAMVTMRIFEVISMKFNVKLATHVHSMVHAIHSCNSKSVTIELHEIRMKVYGALFNGLFKGLFTLN